MITIYIKNKNEEKLFLKIQNFYLLKTILNLKVLFILLFHFFFKSWLKFLQIKGQDLS
jgi:hypothetical protein